MPIQKSSRLPTILSQGSVSSATAKSVSRTRSTIAAAEPQMMACFCCLRGSERAARAMTTALSPERMTLTPMIFSRPIQNACVRSSSNMCARDCTLRPTRARGAKMESPASVDLAKQVLSLMATVLAVGTAFGIAAQKLRIPDVAVFLLAGILVGPGVAGLVDVRADSALNQLILIFGACYILFDGGASLRLSVLKEVWITIVVLATVGVLISALITGVAAWYFLGIPFVVALLLGSAIASTDPATLVPVFRQVKIKDRVAQTVMSESAFNDATGAIATFAVLGIAVGKGEFSVPAALLDLAKQT